MTDRERIEHIQVSVARIEAHVEYLVGQSKQQDDLTRRLAGRTVALESRQDSADKSRRRLWRGIGFICAVIAAYLIEKFMKEVL